MKLKDKVALVTGGGQGLGKSIALAMAKEGASVAICDINTDTLAETTKEIEGRPSLGLRCDVSSSESVQQIFSAIRERFGTLHILVNNAALNPTSPGDEERRNRLYAYQTAPMARQSLGIVTSMTDNDWLRFWGVNVNGGVLL
ncbi:MAG: SDR family oxidoreductase, partial [Candidatus Binataceae bacterium]